MIDNEFLDTLKDFFAKIELDSILHAYYITNNMKKSLNKKEEYSLDFGFSEDKKYNGGLGLSLIRTTQHCQQFNDRDYDKISGNLKKSLQDIIYDNAYEKSLSKHGMKIIDVRYNCPMIDGKQDIVNMNFYVYCNFYNGSIATVKVQNNV